MGNQKFSLSKMIPNAWFYKLKYMNNKSSNNNNNHKPHFEKHHLPPPPAPPSSPPTPAAKPVTTHPRKSYHITRDLNFKTPLSLSSSSSSSTNYNGFDVQLPPILTKPRTTTSGAAGSSPGGGIRLRKAVIAAARKKHRQGQNGNIKRIPETSMGTAVVKASRDPQRDFKESMVEMIVENHLTAAKDLEQLLASYLSLNSQEYHNLIIKVFKQIWLDLKNLC